MNLSNNELNNLKNAYKPVHGIWLGGKVCDYSAKTSKDGFLMWLTNINDSVILAIPAWLNDQSQEKRPPVFINKIGRVPCVFASIKFYR